MTLSDVRPSNGSAPVWSTSDSSTASTAPRAVNGPGNLGVFDILPFYRTDDFNGCSTPVERRFNARCRRVGTGSHAGCFPIGTGWVSASMPAHEEAPPGQIARTCNALQPLQVPLRDALLAWCRWRVRPVAAGRLAGRAWPAACVTWARPSASTAAAFTTARTGTLAGAAATATATLCHDDLLRRVIPAPAKSTPGAHLLAYNCAPICELKIFFLPKIL